MKLTEAQRKALHCLSGARYRTPAEIGWSIGAVDQGKVLKAQGAGRVGSSMAVRLMKRGLASDATWMRDGYPAYAITTAGRAALEQEGK